MKINSLRLFNVYGPKARTKGAYGAVFGVFIGQKLNNLPLTIVGDGNQKRDFVYVTDVCNAFYKCCLSNFYGEIFNVSSGNPISINYISNKISKNKIFIPKRPGEPDMTYGNPKKIKKYLNWKPKVNINNGINNILKNLDWASNAPAWTETKINKITKSWFKYLK